MNRFLDMMHTVWTPSLIFNEGFVQLVLIHAAYGQITMYVKVFRL